MTAEEFVKKQDNVANEIIEKQDSLVKKFESTYKFAEILKPQMKVYLFENQNIHKFVNEINQQRWGSEVANSLKELYSNTKMLEGSELYKQLQPAISQWKILSDNEKFNELMHSCVNENLGGALKQMSSILEDYKLLSLPGVSIGMQDWKDCLEKLDLYGLVKEDYCDTEKSKLEEGFTSNEEIIQALEENEKNPVGFQEKFYNWGEEKKRQYCIVFNIVCIIVNIFLVPYLQEYIGKPVMAWTVAHIKELPEKASEYVTDLKKDIEATIIENVPYYYKVSFVDENGVYREGYVSKRSVKLIETTDEEEIEE